MVLRQILRILAHERDDVLADDRHRRIPVRIDDDLVDRRIEDRRLPVDLADNRSMAKRHAIILDRFDLRGRHIHHHVAVAEEARHRAQPHQIGLQLAKPNRRRDVHRRIGVLADHAVSRQAVARLETLHRGVDIGVEGFRNAGGGRKVAGDHQALAQHHHVGIDNAKLQLLGRGHHRPATLRDDL